MLITNGTDDKHKDSCVAPLFLGIKKVKWVTVGKSSRTHANTDLKRLGQAFSKPYLHGLFES